MNEAQITLLTHKTSSINQGALIKNRRATQKRSHFFHCVWSLGKCPLSRGQCTWYYTRYPDGSWKAKGWEMHSFLSPYDQGSATEEKNVVFSTSTSCKFRPCLQEYCLDSRTSFTISPSWETLRQSITHQRFQGNNSLILSIHAS